MANDITIPTIPEGEDPRTFLAKWIADSPWLAKLRGTLSKAEQKLDEAGVEKKELTEESIADLRLTLAELVPSADEETIDAIIQAVADVVIVPDEVEEEIVEAARDEREDKQESEEIKALTEQVTALASDYSGVYSDMRAVMNIATKAIEGTLKQTKDTDNLAARMAKLEKDIAARPRRASQSPETEVEPDSEMAKNVQERNLADVPEPFHRIFEGGDNEQ
jgi:DNA repair ATPase RecN